MSDIAGPLAGLPSMFRRVSATRGSRPRRPKVSNRRPFGLTTVEVAAPLQNRAAQYVRMSTDHQCYSISHQVDAIGRYACEHGLEVVRTYADAGRSGLSIDGRRGLSSLLEDIVARSVDFGVVLVFDVSRWGRFQDADESACYEFICRCAGIRVEYCAEPFVNDGSPLTTVIKNLKRVMAGEYSRELSSRIWNAKRRVVSLGFFQGGIAPFGLRRMVVGPDGRGGEILEHGQHKYRQSDRVVLVHGPQAEVDAVKWVFEQVAYHNARPSPLARALNDKGLRCASGSLWKADRVQEMLHNVKYIGRLVYNRTSMKLKGPVTLNPPEQWVVTENAIPAIIPTALFDRTQRVMSTWSTRISNETAIDKLSRLLRRRGYLSAQLIDKTRGMPGSHFYDHRFNGLVNAYKLVGFAPKRDCGFMLGYRDRLHRIIKIREEIVQEMLSRQVTAELVTRTTLEINDRLRVAVMLGRCRLEKGVPAWSVQVQLDRRLDWVLIARLEADDGAIRDYWLVEGGVSFVAMGVRPRKRWNRFQSLTLTPQVERLYRLATEASGSDAASSQKNQPAYQNCRFRGS